MASIQIAAPDGSVIHFPEGTSDGEITAAMRKAYPPKVDPATGNAANPIDDSVRALANGMTLGLADRFAAKAGDLTGVGGTQGDYAGNLQNEFNRTDQFKASNPYAANGLNIAGSVALPLGVLGAAAKGVSLGGKALIGAGAGAGIGAVQGAANSRDWTDVPQTAKDALFGAGGGAVVGAGIPLGGAALGAGYRTSMDLLRGGVDGVSRSAARPLLEAIQADGAPAVQSQLRKLGPDAMLADAGPALLGKAQGASLNSDEGRSVLQGALTTRNEGTNARIMSDVNSALGPAEDPQSVTNAIRAYRTQVDNAAYPAALDNAPPVKTAPILRTIDNMIENSVGMERKALENAKGMLMTEERRPVLDASGYPVYDARGFQKFENVPVSQNDANVLHKVKQELDNVIQYDAPGLGVPAGALTRQQGSLKFLRGQLNSTLEDQVPGYAQANAASAALAKRAEAVDAGTQYLGSGKTTPSPDRFAQEFDPLSQGEKIAFAKGSRGNIERVLGTKANDLQALRGELQGEGGWNTAKLAAVHGQDAADQLTGSVDRNIKFRDTYGKVVENSQTAQRTAAANAMKPTPPGEMPFFGPGSTMTGMTVTAAKKAFNGLANSMRPDPTQSFGEIARILSAQGPERDAFVSALNDAINRRTQNASAASRVGNVGAGAAGMVANGLVNDLLRERSGRK